MLPVKKLFQSVNHSFNQYRNLHLYEYQNKEILKRFGLHVQRGGVASSPTEAATLARELKETGATDIILKSQILAGGRGKGTLSSGLQGGVRICSTVDEVQQMAAKMIGYRLVTNQTTSEGEPVEKLLVLEGITIVKELYLAIVLDASTPTGSSLVVSKKGGVDIEAVAKNNPDDVVTIPIQDCRRISRAECLLAAEALGVASDSQAFPLNVADQIARLFDLFVKMDAVVVEVNPLAVTSKSPDHVVCVDAKITIDDNAAFRQKEIMEMEEISQVDPREYEASKYGLSFVPMNGSIGCIVNGAGLAMATMDIIKLHGGVPANFMDVGGGADVEQVERAFKIVQADPNVKVMFVNIFGGIMRCDVIAEGLVAAAKASHLTVPLVVRLVGNRVENGKEILRNSALKCVVVDDFESAAMQACQFAL